MTKHTELTQVANFPARTVFSWDQFNIELNVEKFDGQVRTTSKTITIKAFKGDKHEYLRDFTIGWDKDDGVWAYGNGAMITSSPTEHSISLGYELGDTIRIDGDLYTIEEAPNHNIKLVAQ
jgi:hypothetical protein